MKEEENDKIFGGLYGEASVPVQMRADIFEDMKKMDKQYLK